ncbi:Asp23/Gls24 family envelope stress response protein [Streptomyces sp. NPDC048644]|uniref:Asp23/Gls24 family envelope stress response protein n=1 Tax=Streptomyces sp. NPDC048644 TaxID=3365582 RepID=UPI00371CCCF7
MASNDNADGSGPGTSSGGFGTRGTTTIADTVVATLAGIAVRETDGIHAVGGSGSRALGSVREKVSKSPAPSRGIKVEVGETQAAIDHLPGSDDDNNDEESGGRSDRGR